MSPYTHAFIPGFRKAAVHLQIEEDHFCFRCFNCLYFGWDSGYWSEKILGTLRGAGKPYCTALQREFQENGYVNLAAITVYPLPSERRCKSHHSTKYLHWSEISVTEMAFKVINLVLVRISLGLLKFLEISIEDYGSHQKLGSKTSQNWWWRTSSSLIFEVMYSIWAVLTLRKSNDESLPWYRNFMMGCGATILCCSNCSTILRFLH